MKTWQTKNEYLITQVLSGRSNAYLIVKDNHVILADTGKKTAFATLSRNIDSLNLTVDDITILILTHTHFDHCQSARKIKERSDCQVMVSRFATDSIKNGYAVLPDGTFPATKLIARFGRLIGKRKFGFEPFQPDIYITEEFDTGIADSRIKILETAGHSIDSVSLLVDNEIAIVGDAMFGVLKNSIIPPYSDDRVKMIESWGQLLNTDCQIFLPGHGKEIQRNLLQKEYSKYARKYNID